MSIFSKCFSVIALLLCLSAPLKAGDPKEATLIVDRKSDPSSEAMEFTLDGVSIGKAELPGRVYEFRFKVGKDGVTYIKEQYKGTFGTSSITRRLTLLPGGTEKIVYGSERGTRSIVGQTLNSGIDISTLKITLDDTTSEKEVASEIVSTPAGVKRTVKRTRTIEHSVSQTETKGAEAAAKLDFGILSGEIRGKIEVARNQTFKQSETIEQSVEIDGNILPKAKIIWIERGVTGKASFVSNGKKTEVPFTLSETLELQVVPVK